MTSHAGSAPAGRPSVPAGDAAPFSREKIMSAMLTYFWLIVTPQHAFTKGSCSECLRGDLHQSARRGCAKRTEHYPDLADDAKKRRGPGRETKEAASGRRKGASHGRAVL